MSDVADRFVALLDANVLFPFRVRDALLRFAEAGLFRARWSQDIIDEWYGSLVVFKPHLKSSIDSQLDAMRRAFPESWVEGYQGFIDSLELPDPNDRHVLAAAIVCGAEHIVTENLRDFPEPVLKKFGIEAVSADDFLASTYEMYPAEGTAAFRVMRRAYQNPTMTPAAFIFDLQAKGLPKTASLLKLHIDVI